MRWNACLILYEARRGTQEHRLPEIFNRRCCRSASAKDTPCFPYGAYVPQALADAGRNRLTDCFRECSGKCRHGLPALVLGPTGGVSRTREGRSARWHVPAAVVLVARRVAAGSLAGTTDARGGGGHVAAHVRRGSETHDVSPVRKLELYPTRDVSTGYPQP